MLVLAREYQQSVVIGGTIRVTVTRDSKGSAGLIFHAPASVPIHRDEDLREEILPAVKLPGEGFDPQERRTAGFIRDVGQSVMVGDDIRVCVVRISENRVDLGIIAPREVHIVREELLGRKPGPERF